MRGKKQIAAVVLAVIFAVTAGIPHSTVYAEPDSNGNAQAADAAADVGTAAGNDAADGNKCRRHSRYYAVRLRQPGDNAELSGGRRQLWYVRYVKSTPRPTL